MRLHRILLACKPLRPDSRKFSQSRAQNPVQPKVLPSREPQLARYLIETALVIDTTTSRPKKSTN